MAEQFPEWFYDEAAYCGVNFSDAATAAKYDARHQRFRDYAQEARHIIRLMDLRPTDTVLDFAAGTGGFTVHAAPYVRRICAVDISEPMLDVCRGKCRAAGIDNVEFHRGGFLTYRHNGPPVDAVVCQIALHHLPDMWKQVALLNIFNLLRPGGKFLLADVVFSFDIRDYRRQIDNWLKVQMQNAGPEALTHIKREYSTMDWILQGLLQRAGFTILKAEQRDHFIQVFLCQKPDNEVDIDPQ
jgi:putative AdoMet-dependent methyltransferase